jgi:multidrug efflux pump subunit AcrB
MLEFVAVVVVVVVGVVGEFGIGIDKDDDEDVPAAGATDATPGATPDTVPTGGWLDGFMHALTVDLSDPFLV